MELDLQVSPVQGGGAALRKLDFFRFGLFLNSSATDIVLVTLPSTAVETAVAQCTSRCAMARGHRLNTSIVLAVVHGLSGLFRAVPAVEPSLSRPLPPPPPPSPVPVSNKQPRFCGRKATWSCGERRVSGDVRRWERGDGNAPHGQADGVRTSLSGPGLPPALHRHHHVPRAQVAHP